MYIEEIIIDGFKSYSTRTVISGFDPKFNAITGLNGSGKSNILDAICFVLGISNLSQVFTYSKEKGQGFQLTRISLQTRASRYFKSKCHYNF